ncbi:MAG: hypothetical protein IT233_05450 [Bacteroidia bacterium]|nr:hypothetical protein [Bacteroidia bacterium]
MEYSKYHKTIVQSLLDGKFLLRNEPEFIELREKEEFYSEFFKASFDYELKVTTDYSYLISSETSEITSRDICIFFALICYELDRDGKNFIDELNYAEFEISQVENYFANSAYIDLIHSNKQLKDKDSRKNFINMLSRRSIIEKRSEEKFTFTPAYKVFIDFARDLARKRMEEQQPTA